MKQLNICSQQKDFFGEVKYVFIEDFAAGNYYDIIGVTHNQRIKIGRYPYKQAQEVIKQIAHQMYNDNEGFVLYFMPEIKKD